MTYNDDYSGDRAPVPPPPPRRQVAPGQAKVAAAEKLLRRLMALEPGRYEIILTVGGGDGIADWSIRYFEIGRAHV